MVLESEWVFGSVNRWVFRGGFVGLNQNGSEDCVGFESLAVYGVWVFGVLMVIVSFSTSLMAWTSSAMVAW